jgi:hypothetical protein
MEMSSEDPGFLLQATQCLGEICLKLLLPLTVVNDLQVTVFLKYLLEGTKLFAVLKFGDESGCTTAA